MKHLPSALGATLIIALSGMGMQSCRKPGCTNPQADNFDESATSDDGSCYKRGCMDPQSENYDYSATQDDGSCSYLNEKFIGAYSVQETYSSINCGNGNDSYTVVITKLNGSGSELSVTGLGGGMAAVKFTVFSSDPNKMVGSFTEDVNSPMGFLDFASGSGSISGNTMQLNYMVYSNPCSYITASATMTKQ